MIILIMMMMCVTYQSGVAIFVQVDSLKIEARIGADGLNT